MNKQIYHGILLDAEFINPDYPNKFKVFARRISKSNPWTLFGVEVPAVEIENLIPEMQKEMRADQPYYLHFYNDIELIVVFKTKVFKATPHISSWGEIQEYGRSLQIPELQLNIWPNRFQDEVNYFNPEDFIKA